MAEFSVTDAAFTGFRVVRERPWAVAIWAALILAYSLGSDVFIALTAGLPFTELTQVQTQIRAMQSEQAMLGLFEILAQAAPTAVAVVIALLVMLAVLISAMNRSISQPQDSRFGYLRLASDELRQLGLLAMMFGLMLAVFMVVTLVTSVLIATAGPAIGLGNPLAAAPAMDAALFTALSVIAVRMSLASPMTFATHRVALFRAWRVIQGRTWRMAGAYAIALALAVVVILLVSQIDIAVLAVAGGDTAINAAKTADWRSLAVVLSPPKLIYAVISAIGGALAAPIVFCPPIAIYRVLTAGDAR